MLGTCLIYHNFHPTVVFIEAGMTKESDLFPMIAYYFPKAFGPDKLDCRQKNPQTGNPDGEVQMFDRIDSETSKEPEYFLLCFEDSRLAKILHASGMAKAFEEDFDQWESTKASINVLREDGQTDIAKLLDSAKS